MASPTLTPIPSKRRINGLRLAAALVLVAVGGFVLSTCQSSTKPILGACTNPDNTVFAYNISQQQCQSSCPACTWHQNQ
jgi:hypothetical protein